MKLEEREAPNLDPFEGHLSSRRQVPSVGHGNRQYHRPSGVPPEASDDQAKIKHWGDRALQAARHDWQIQRAEHRDLAPDLERQERGGLTAWWEHHKEAFSQKGYAL